MAAMEHGSDVQAYLDKHKIPKLFEDLLSKIVKQQPSSPFDFLISTLQTMKHSTPSNDEVVVASVNSERRGRPVSSSVRASKLKSPSVNTERRSQQIAGSARTSKLKSPHVSSERRGRQMTSSDPSSKLKVEGSAKGQPNGHPKAISSSSSSISKTPPASKTTPLASSIPKTSKSTPRQVGSKLRTPTATPTHPTTPHSAKKPVTKSAVVISLPSKLPGATRLPGVTPSKLKTPQTATKGGRKSVGDTAVGRGKTSILASSSKPKAKVLPHISTSEQAVSQTRISHPAATKQVPALVPKPVPLAEDVDEFFGAGKEASTRLYQTYSDEEEESPTGQRVEESSGETDKEEEEEESGGGGGRGGVDGDEKSEDIDLDRIIEQRKSSKHIKQTYLETLLATTTQKGPETTPPSEGYFSEVEEGEDGEEGDVEMVEDFEALEEEGVSGLRKSKYAVREVPAVGQAVLDLKLRICAQCARVISGQDGVTSDSITEGTQPTASEVEFESASQVGSNISFPQWNASSGSELSGGRFVPTDGSEVSSDVTLQSESMWGGLAPPPRPATPPSEEESAVQLPPPPPLPDQPWPVDTPTSRDPYGWGQ